MKKSDLIGWDWKIQGRELVVFPTASAYGKYLLHLLVGPVLVLVLLSIAGATPWGIYWGPKASAHRKPLVDEAEKERIEQFQQQTIDNLREVLGEEEIEQILAKTAEEQKLRQSQTEQSNQPIRWVGLIVASLVGLIWLIMFGLGVLYLAAFIRLPTATYRFFRNPRGELVIRIPHLFSTSEHRVSVAAIRDCKIGKYTQRVGKYGIRVFLWYVAIIPKPSTLNKLPLFVVADEFPKDSTGRPPDRATEFLKAIRKIGQV